MRTTLLSCMGVELASFLRQEHRYTVSDCGWGEEGGRGGGGGGRKEGRKEGRK